MTKLSGQQIADEGLEVWAYLLGGLQTRLHTGTFAAGLSIVTAIGGAAEKMDHHPELDLRYSHLDVRLASHDVQGVTDRDIRLAHTISAIAGDTGVRMECASISRLELAIDSPAFASILPFWQAVLASTSSSAAGKDDDVRDAFGTLPTIWFQPSGSAEPRQHWHPDLWIDPAQVGARIDAALAAGGTLVSDEEAPSFWVLADPDGNKVCLCTWQDR
jgi:4a-hydroxytetrahydrobiopterin dehydratase